MGWSVPASARKGPLPGAIVVALAVAGCAGRQEASREPSMRVADAALASGAPEIALRVADLALARDPRNVEALVAKGDALYGLGQREGAQAAYRQAVTLDPKLATAQMGLGRTLVQADPGAAEGAFLAVVAAQPGDSTALNDLGIARDLQGRHAEAQDAYRRALAISPAAADVKVNLGLSLALTGDKGAAVEILREAAVVPGVVQGRGKELAAALTLAGDEAAARQVLAAVPVQPTAGAIAAVEMPPAPSSVNRGAAVAVKPKQDVAAEDRPAAVRPAEAPQRDAADALSGLSTAPVVAVNHTRLSPLSEATPEALMGAVALPVPKSRAEPAPSEPQQSPVSSASETGAFVQLASVHSLDDARFEWRRLSRLFPALLGGHTPVIVQADALGQSYWCLRTFGFADLAGATAMCTQAHGTTGLKCWARVAS